VFFKISKKILSELGEVMNGAERKLILLIVILGIVEISLYKIEAILTEMNKIITIAKTLLGN
jgi:hypothetical protein